MQLQIHPEHPEPRKMEQAAEAMRRGGVIAYPTDTVYALGCDIMNKKAIEAIYRMKGMDKSHLLSFVCHDLSEVARFGLVEDYAYRTMRRLTPGPYTFILKATKEVPKVLRLKRQTVGIRIPDHPVPLALTALLGVPVASTSASLDGEILCDPAEIDERFNGLAMVLDPGQAGMVPSTIIDFSQGGVEVVREGAGPVDSI